MKKLIFLIPFLAFANDTQLYQRLILLDSYTKEKGLEKEFITFKKSLCEEVLKNEKAFHKLRIECKGLF